MNRIGLLVLVLVVALLVSGCVVQIAPNSYAPQCVWLDGETVWLHGISPAGFVDYEGAECIPGVGLLAENETVLGCVILDGRNAWVVRSGDTIRHIVTACADG